MKQTPIQKAIKRCEERIAELNKADSEVCKLRWDMTKSRFERGIARDTSNSLTERRQELQDELKYLQSLLAEERQMVEDAAWFGHDNRPEMIHVPETFASDYFTQTYQQ